MKNLPLIAFVCSIMIPFSVQGQSANLGSSGLRHGDVQNIGTRTVSGRIFGVLPNRVSLEEERVLGQQMATKFEQTSKLLKDPVITEYINRLGQNLVRHSDAKVPFRVKVVDADAADVLALPGGFLYVSKGLILEAESEAELAGAMAHAIAHVCARHATELQSKMEYLQLSTSTLSAGAPLSLPAINHSFDSGLGIKPELVGMARNCERDADQLGIQYLWNTGYDPNAVASLLEKMQVREKTNSGRSAAFLRAYPSADRIPQCMEEQRALPKKDFYLTSSLEFSRVKARMLAER
jgi:predicted Zn-dependent protease